MKKPVIRLVLLAVLAATQASQIGAATVAATCGGAAPGEAGGIGLPMLRVASHDPTTGRVSLTYGAACSATGHALVFGPLQAVSDHDYSGQVCDIGAAPAYEWSYPQESMFFLVVGHDGAVEGSYGTSADGVERPSHTGGSCPREQDLAARCDPSARQTVGPSGGALGVQNCNGDTLMLEFPAGALDQPLTIRMTALAEPAESPFATKVIRGLDIQPHQLRLAAPATLRWQSGSVDPLPTGARLFWVVDENLALVLGDQIWSSSELVATVRHFSTFDAAEPTLEELENQQSVEPQSLGLPGDPYLLLEVQEFLEYFWALAELAETTGSFELAEFYRQKAKDYLAQSIREFLAFPPPSVPCEEYYPALSGYLSLAGSLLSDNNPALVDLESRRLSIDGHWCCFSLDGAWTAVEVADERDCEEGVNTYTASVTIVQSGSVVAFLGFNGSAFATKDRCSLSAFGSESEDSGVSYGSGGGTVDASGKRIFLAGSWTWTGDEESCSGTSEITMTRP